MADRQQDVEPFLKSRLAEMNIPDNRERQCESIARRLFDGLKFHPNYDRDSQDIKQLIEVAIAQILSYTEKDRDKKPRR